MAEFPSVDALGARHDESWTGRAFLVQLSLDACPSSGRFCGRVQHMRSCDAAHFGSLDELGQFMRVRVSDPQDDGGSGLSSRHASERCATKK